MADDPWIWLKVTPLSLHSLSSEGWQNFTWNFIILSKCIFSLLSIRTYFVLQFVLHFVVNQTSREAYIIMDYISKKCTVQNIYRKCLSFIGRYCVWYTLFCKKTTITTTLPIMMLSIVLLRRIKSTQCKKLATNALWFTYQYSKACKPHEKKHKKNI